LFKWLGVLSWRSLTSFGMTVLVWQGREELAIRKKNELLMVRIANSSLLIPNSPLSSRAPARDLQHPKQVVYVPTIYRITKQFLHSGFMKIRHVESTTFNLLTAVFGHLTSDFELPLQPPGFSQIGHRGYSAGMAFFLPIYHESEFFDNML
jgi:hypothetical protein